MQILWNQLDYAGWSTRMDTAGAVAFQQSWVYGVAAAACGANVSRTLIIEGGQDLALAQVLDRWGLRLINRGPVWLQPFEPWQKRRILQALARGLTLANLEDHVTGFGVVPQMTGRFQAIWDLRPAPEVLRAGLDRKWAGRLSAAERAGIQACVGGSDALDTLLREDMAQRRHRGYRSLPPGFIRALPPGCLHVWQWLDDGKVGAAMAFVRHGQSATYQIGWAGAAARTQGVHQAMLWQAAMALRADGVCLLDLGTVDTESAPGLARFKLGTGAALRQLGPTAWVLPRWSGHKR